MSRTRVRDQSQTMLLFTKVGSPDQTETGYLTHESCVDDLGSTLDHPLTLKRKSSSGGDIDWLGTYHCTGQSGHSETLPNWGTTETQSLLTTITAQKIAASTAPLRPKVDIVTDFLEWRDVPKMLKHAGDLILDITYSFKSAINYLNNVENLASSILAWQFGWGPLLQDLSRVIDFGGLVAQRQQEIGALNSGKTVRRKIHFGGLSGTASGTTTIHSTLGVVIQPSYHLDWNSEVWATIRWKLADAHHLLNPPTWLEAFRSVYGLDGPLQLMTEIWKALPWSWLIDWFANISDALIVSKNLLTYAPSNINRMWKVSRTIKINRLNPSLHQLFSEMNQTEVEKNRDQPSIGGITGIHLGVPFLDAFRQSVLGSLAILKIKRGLRA